MRFGVLLLAALALAGCAGKPQGPAELATFSATPVAPASIAGIPSSDYRINPLDQVRIDVFQEPELSLRDLPVDSNGTIIMPLAGRIEAKGRTAAELSDDIAQRLNRYLRHPQVAVNVTQFTSQRVTVTGSVGRPGIYDSPQQVTLVQAIALAGGLAETARHDEVLVFRTQNGQRMIARFDIAQIQAGLAPDPVVQPGDTVVVGYSQARRLLRDALTIVPVVLGVFYLLK